MFITFRIKERQKEKNPLSPRKKKKKRGHNIIGFIWDGIKYAFTKLQIPQHALETANFKNTITAEHVMHLLISSYILQGIQL